MSEERKSSVAQESPASISKVDLRAKGSRLWMVVVVGGALVAGVAGAMFAFKGKESADENAKKAAAAAGDGTEAADGTMGMAEAKAVIAEGLREDFAKAPCNKGIAFKLVTRLIEAGDYTGAGDASDTYTQKCPEPFTQLWRKGFTAHDRAGRWANAEATATALIRAEPDEGSFWWWRGQARKEQNHLGPAAADLRQAMAGTPFPRSTGKSLLDFAEIADKIGATCDAAAALQAFTDAKQGNVNLKVPDLQSKLHLAGKCEDTYGAGGFGAPANAAIDKIKVKVGKTEGSFLFGATTGYTLLSAAFAAKAGVVAAGDPVDTYAAGQLLSGKPAIAPEITYGDGTAPDIHVLVIDQLPGELDGVIGQSFLYRFRIPAAPEPEEDEEDEEL